MTIDLGRVGIWSRELRYNPDRGARAAAAAELENLLTATQRISLATGALNIWMHDPVEVARWSADLVARFGPRFLLGLGNSHAPLVEGTLGVPYTRPYS